ncbi:DUF1513 domain-containing protein [Marinobacter sp.]|uniref:DUF1513 domain-containing protein n=1 Tax=Marinobacter sp. TaxID=50741 RepID=UPI002B279338|nr:DUF1513 domain-containing protein [Marinobacter sp.]
MDTSRRQLLKAALGGSAALSLSGCSLLPRKSGFQPEQYSAAVGRPDGTFGISSVDLQGQPLWVSAVETRCHSGCMHPRGNKLVFFERRPGWSFYVLDAHTGRRLHHIEAAPGEHFVGHGVFSPDGRWLYATASRYEPGEGIVAVYDAEQNYQRTNTFELAGIGPHQITLHPDGETLAIALGGILTHPDYDRLKLNLDTMAPALILMNRRSGKIVGRLTPSHHQQSLRHLDIHPSGKVYVAYQHQGPRHETPALLARMENNRLQEIRFDGDTQIGLGNYIASVIAHPENDLVAAASPVGGTAVVFQGSTGKLLAKASIPDCSGVQALAGGDFLISSGQGKLVRLGANQAAQELSQLPLYWDHHLV